MTKRYTHSVHEYLVSNFLKPEVWCKKNLKDWEWSIFPGEDTVIKGAMTETDRICVRTQIAAISLLFQYGIDAIPYKEPISCIFVSPTPGNPLRWKDVSKTVTVDYYLPEKDSPSACHWIVVF